MINLDLSTKINSEIVQSFSIENKSWKTESEINFIKLKRGIRVLKKNLVGNLKNSSINDKKDIISAFDKIGIKSAVAEDYVNSINSSVRLGIYPSQYKNLFIERVSKNGDFAYRVSYRFR